MENKLLQSSVKQRIKQILRSKKIQIPLLAEGDENLRRTLFRQINEETTLAISTVIFILDKFPDVSAEWLLRGEGDMFKHTNPATIQTQNGGIGNTQNMNTYTEPIDLLRTEIAAKNEQLKVKDDQLRAKDDQIAKLLDMLNK